MGAKFLDVMSAIVVVAGIMVMTRPGSQGPGLVQAGFGGFSQALGVATGGATTTTTTAGAVPGAILL